MATPQFGIDATEETVMSLRLWALKLGMSPYKPIRRKDQTVGRPRKDDLREIVQAAYEADCIPAEVTTVFRVTRLIGNPYRPYMEVELCRLLLDHPTLSDSGKDAIARWARDAKPGEYMPTGGSSNHQKIYVAAGIVECCIFQKQEK